MSYNPATYLSIDLNALVHNYRFIKSKLQPKTKFLAVIKAFAYGHESLAIAQKLEKENVDYIAISYTREGIVLREAGIKTPILILHPQVNEIQNCINHSLEPTIYSFRIFDAFSKAIDNLDVEKFPIHLKFNTGMNRLGFSFENISKLTKKLNNNTKLQVASAYSHLVASEDPSEEIFTQEQLQKFKKNTTELEKTITYPFLKHLTNTAGTLNYPAAHFDMVRVGIGLYGYANSKVYNKYLKNVGSLYSLISQIQKVKAGQSVGYNRTFTAQQDSLSATIPIGYADGIPRSWSKGVGFVYINGKKAQIIGNVCMGMITVDVTKIACKEGDRVIIFDTQETVKELARKTNTISYEILTAISQRVPRIIK